MFRRTKRTESNQAATPEKQAPTTPGALPDILAIMERVTTPEADEATVFEAQTSFTVAALRMQRPELTEDQAREIALAAQHAVYEANGFAIPERTLAQIVRNELPQPPESS